MAKRLGILGDGQLGLYLCQAARALQVHATVLCGSPDSPAASAADEIVLGALDDAEAVQAMIERCDAITYELEAIPNETLNLLKRAEASGQVAVHPGVQTLFMLKDKGLQKTWLREHGFPSADHVLIPGTSADARKLVDALGPALVQKARSGGYDGMGVQLLRGDDPEQLQNDLWNTPSVMEVFIPDCREIAVLVVRGKTGEMAIYPPVGMEFDDGLNALSVVLAPAALEQNLATEALQLAGSVVEALHGVGVFAIEMFITRDGQLLVNEISPRVHNSGHLTMEAYGASQFEQHVRAVMGLPLAPIQQVSPAAMVNVLYHELLENSCPLQPTRAINKESKVTVHWYGKAPGRLGRKMGHITALGDSPRSAAENANEALAALPSQVAA